LEIIKEENISEARKQELGIEDWAPWEKQASTFDWSYSETETCYILEGAVTVEGEDGEYVEAGEGDLVQFPAGLNCTWTISRDLRKVFTFDEISL